MSVGITNQELLSGYAGWLKWLGSKEAGLEGKQAKLEARAAKRSNPAADVPVAEEAASAPVAMSAAEEDDATPAPVAEAAQAAETDDWL